MSGQTFLRLSIATLGVIAGLLVILSGATLFEPVSSYLVDAASISPTTVYAGTLVALTALVLSALSYGTFSFLTRRDVRVPDAISELKDLMQRLNDIQSAPNITVSETFHEDIAKIIRTNISDDFVNMFSNRYAAAAIEDKLYQRIQSSIGGARDRINGEIRQLRDRANLNFTVGISVGAIGLAILLFSVANFEGLFPFSLRFSTTIETSMGPQTIELGPTKKDNEPLDFTAFMIGFLPRLSLVIVTEILAFFFLNLYRANFNEIKYFQNELTNWETKCLAIDTTILAKDEKRLSEISGELARVDRNFILKKGETTKDLEELRIQSNFVKSLIDKFPALSQIVKKDPKSE